MRCAVSIQSCSRGRGNAHRVQIQATISYACSLHNPEPDGTIENHFYVEYFERIDVEKQYKNNDVIAVVYSAHRAILQKHMCARATCSRYRMHRDVISHR